jgi:hypothetical protein
MDRQFIRVVWGNMDYVDDLTDDFMDRWEKHISKNHLNPLNLKFVQAHIILCLIFIK